MGVKAARAAQIHDFNASLPVGYGTTVGERGLKLSGGEKQRVGIARTLLKDPPILLLDEATSALDSESEREIHDALENAGKGRTVISIAHRLEGGEIVEIGEHSNLLKNRSRYFELWNMQLKAS